MFDSSPDHRVKAVRIGIVCPYSLTVPGGVQGQVLGLARTLRRAGHEVRVLAPCDGPPPDGGVTPLGASLPTSSNGSVAPIAPDPSAQLRLIRALRDEEFDVVHIHEPFCPGPCQTALVFKNAAIVATYHASGTLLYKYFRPMVVRAARNIDVSCVVSEDARATAAEHIDADFRMLWNGVEVEEFRDGAATPTDGPTVLFVGRHEPRKGLDVLLAALPYLPAHVRIWIGSDGPDTARLQQQHSGDSRLEWMGRITDAEKGQRLRGAHVFVTPSLSGESFGIVLLEGMAARTPVVASDISGYRAVAGDGRYAALVEPGNPQALAAEIRRVFDDQTRTAALVAAGAARADEYSMDRLASAYLELYGEAIDTYAASRGRARR